MNLPKAIELITDLANTFQSFRTPDDVDAVKLGIEAAKRIEFYRRDKCHVANIKLPGETDE